MEKSRGDLARFWRQSRKSVPARSLKSLSPLLFRGVSFGVPSPREIVYVISLMARGTVNGSPDSSAKSDSVPRRWQPSNFVPQNTFCNSDPSLAMPPSKITYDLPSAAPSSVLREDGIEDGFIGTLQGLKYEYRRDITNRATLERNFREKFEALNRVHLTDAEFARLLDEIVTPDVFAASKTLRSITSFTRDDGTPLNYTLVNLKDWCKNTFEVVNQLRINTDHSHHRYDVLLLINGVPAVQIELKTLGISPRRAITSFKASTLLKLNDHIQKCGFVVDRKDLDRQTREEFNRFQENCVEENTNTAALVRRLLSDNCPAFGESRQTKETRNLVGLLRSC